MMRPKDERRDVEARVPMKRKESWTLESEENEETLADKQRRRKEKNREAARRLRERRVDMIKQLNEEVVFLREENKNLKTDKAGLAIACKRLEQECAYLHQLLNRVASKDPSRDCAALRGATFERSPSLEQSLERLRQADADAAMDVHETRRAGSLPVGVGAGLLRHGHGAAIDDDQRTEDEDMEDEECGDDYGSNGSAKSVKDVLRPAAVAAAAAAALPNSAVSAFDSAFRASAFAPGRMTFRAGTNGTGNGTNGNGISKGFARQGSKDSSRISETIALQAPDHRMGSFTSPTEMDRLLAQLGNLPPGAAAMVAAAAADRRASVDAAQQQEQVKNALYVYEKLQKVGMLGAFGLAGGSSGGSSAGGGGANSGSDAPRDNDMLQLMASMLNVNGSGSSNGHALKGSAAAAAGGQRPAHVIAHMQHNGGGHGGSSGLASMAAQRYVNDSAAAAASSADASEQSVDAATEALLQLASSKV